MGERPEVSVGAAANAAEQSAMTVFQTALYTVQERLKTFQTSKFSWPFDSGPCTPKSVSGHNGKFLNQPISHVSSVDPD